VTRGENVKFVQENFDSFSHEVFTIPRSASPIRMPPLTLRRVMTQGMACLADTEIVQ